MRRIVVVGGGISGVSTVAALRSGGFDGDLTLVDAGEFPYDRPPLSKDLLKGAKNLDDIALQPRCWYEDKLVRLIPRTTVTALRADIGGVELGDGTTLRADRVVLATGGSAARPSIPGVDSPLVHVVRTVEDVDRLRCAMMPGARVLVVGAGLIGAEVASTAVDMECDVVLVDPVLPPLISVVGPEVASWLHDLHARRGVRTVHTRIESFVDDGLHVEVPGIGVFDVVVLGLGMIPDTELARAAGLDVGRGVLVDRCQVTSNPAVLAVGDSARVRGGTPAGHWESAQHGGQRAATTMLGLPAPQATAPWFWTDRHHRHVEVVGKVAGAGTNVVRGLFGVPPFSVFGLRGDRVVGAVAVDDPISARAARRLIDRGVAVDRADLADSAADLRKLLRG